MNAPFLYELHLHTAETSRCGQVPANQQVVSYHARGYAGIVVTDHFHHTYFSSLPCKDDWDACVDCYLSGYRAAKAAGAAVGMDVLLGAELRFEQENMNDYLLYGIDEAFLRANPYPYRLGHEEFFKRFGQRVLILQAHPFRNGNREVYPHSIHGAEVVNCNVRHDNHNELAEELCDRERGFVRICGSDAHRVGDEAHAAILLPCRATDSMQLRQALLQGGYRLYGDRDTNIIQRANGLLESK